MKYTPKIEKAIKTATSAHDGQYRKAYKNPRLPYVSHLFSVASIISEHTDDEDIIIAGLLHDILEDTDFEATLLLQEFGQRVHELVDCVTEATKKEKETTTWKEEKENYLRKLRNGPREASIIASADKIHNLLATIDSKILVTRNPEEYIWYHREVFAIISDKLGDHPIVEKHKNAMTEAGKTYRDRVVHEASSMV